MSKTWQFCGWLGKTIITTGVLVPALALMVGCSSMSKSEIYSAACVGADVLTTAWGISEGYQEVNPIYPEDEMAVVTGALVGTGVHILMRHLKAPAPAWLGYGSMRCSAAALNVQTVSKGTAN